MAVRIWKVYGQGGHRQRESFNKSYLLDLRYNNVTRIIAVYNSDKTGSNMYSIVKIVRDSAVECWEELHGQISDGIFENSRVGRIERISAVEFNNIISNRRIEQ